MRLLANCSNRDRGLIRSSHKWVWLLIGGLQVSGLIACAEEARPSHGIKKASQDTLIVNSSKSKLPSPSQKMLDDVLSSLKHVRVIDCGMELDGKPYSKGTNEALDEPFSGSIVFESSDPKVLRELTEYLRIREGSEYPGPFFAGAPTFELTLSDGRVVHIGLVAGQIIRWGAWRYDAELLNPSRFVHWLANHGVEGPLREGQKQLEYNRLEDEKLKASLDEFVQTMPTSLRGDFFGPLISGESTCLEDLSEKYGKIPKENRLKLAKSALSQQFPNESDQIGELLEWEGKISNAWAAFQIFPIELLLEYDPSQVLSKVKGPSMSPAQWIGACRYYSRSDFKRKFPSGYKPLDNTLRELIVKNVRATGKNELDVEHFEESMHNWLPR